MLNELVLIAIAVSAGIAVSRLWVLGRKAWAALLCVAVALLVTWLARRWHVDLSGMG